MKLLTITILTILISLAIVGTVIAINYQSPAFVETKFGYLQTKDSCDTAIKQQYLFNKIGIKQDRRIACLK